MRNLSLTLLFSCFLSDLNAQEIYENSLFGVQQDSQQFASLDEMVTYIKDRKPTTFVYYDRLSQPAKKQVFQLHQQEPETDITELILKVYRQRARR